MPLAVTLPTACFFGSGELYERELRADIPSAPPRYPVGAVPYPAAPEGNGGLSLKSDTSPVIMDSIVRHERVR